MKHVRSSQVLVSSLALLAFACSGGGEKTIVEPPPPPPVTAMLKIAFDPQYVAVAQALGWSAGVPSAEVVVTNAAVRKEFTTDASGSVELSGIVEGKYRVEAKRVLQADELAMVASTGDFMGFVGDDSINVTRSGLPITVTIPASRRKSLVISEYAWAVAFALGVAVYQDGGSFELYNNSDATVYLDGMGIGFAFDLFVDGTIQSTRCSTTEPLRNDPQGLWVQSNQMFPGSGHDYPVLPGGFVTIAQDAIDHAPFFTGLPDLRNADFELMGPADVDNPSVPNMINRSLDESLGPHGLPIKASGAPLVLFAPIDISALPTMKDPRNERLWTRIPANHVLDVATKIPPVTTILDGSILPWCNPIMAKNFDREPGRFMYGDESISFKFSPQRKVIGMTSDGRRILQDTGSSAVDFERLPVTPFGF